MNGRAAFVRAMAAAGVASALWACLTVQAEEKRTAPAAKSGKVVGIVTDRKDTFIMVKPEGKQESERFALAAAGGTVSPTLQAALKTVFIPNLVALKWQRQEEEPVVTEITVVRPKTRMGTVFGTVVAHELSEKTKSCYFDVKPAGGQGFTECYWPRFIPNQGGFDKDMIETIGKLNVGDKVKVDWVCDERKRAAKLQVLSHAPAPKKTETGKE